MKKKGDQSVKSARSIHDISQDLALAISKPDSRYDYFWNYKPIPAVMDFFASKKKVKAIIGANKCLHKDQEIFDPEKGTWTKVSEIKDNFHVLSWNGKRLVKAKAFMPFLKGYGEMYRVSFSSGTHLLCSGTHEVLRNPDNSYLSVDQLCVGDSVFLPASISDNDLLTQEQDDPSCAKTVEGCSDGYHACCRSCDGRLHPASNICQSCFPLQGDVPIHNATTFSLNAKGGLENKPIHNRAGLFCRHPIVDAVLRSAVRSLMNTIRNIFCMSGQSPDARIVIESLSTKEAVQVLPVHECNPTCVPDDDVACDTPLLHSTLITAIEPLGQGEIWDFTVPIFHNYLAGGVINHNSAKTTTGVFETIMIYTGIIPPAVRDIYPHKIPSNRPRRVRIIVQNLTKHWPETIRPLLLGDPSRGEEGMLPRAWAEYDPAEHIFYGPDGSYLSIVSVDPHERVDPNILRGPLIDHTWIDEINQEVVFTESLTRGVSLKDGPRTVTLTFCPQEGYGCWTFETLYQACYDPLTKQRKPEKQCHPDIYAVRVSMRDNPSISEEQRQMMISTLRPWEVAFRVDGEYSQRAANAYFNMDMLMKWETEHRYSDGDPYKCVEKSVDLDHGIFKGELRRLGGLEFNENNEPVWRIWEQPKQGEKYVLVADTAEGTPDSDYQNADLWRCTNYNYPVQVAQLRIKNMKPGDFAVQCACMGNVYGDCLVAPETNNTSGGIFIDRIRHYRNLYKRMTYDRQLKTDTEKIGWHTDKTTKGPMLETLYKMLGEIYSKTEDGKSGCPIRSRFTLNELMGYEEHVERDKMNVATITWSARAGCHDDTVITMAIAFRIARNEFHKLSTCRIEKNLQPLYRSSIEEGAKKYAKGEAFAGMRKKKGLLELSGKTSRREAIHGVHG